MMAWEIVQSYPNEPENKSENSHQLSIADPGGECEPSTSINVELPVTRQITGAHPHVVGRVHRLVQFVLVEAAARKVVLHAQGFGDALLELLEDAMPDLLFEDRAQDVEIEVGVVKVGPRKVAAS